MLRRKTECVTAAWGIALSTTERSGADAPQKDLSKGWEELRPWLAAKADTEREQMYIDAVRAMYEGYASVPGSKRWILPRSHGAASDKIPR